MAVPLFWHPPEPPRGSGWMNSCPYSKLQSEWLERISHKHAVVAQATIKNSSDPCYLTDPQKLRPTPTFFFCPYGHVTHEGVPIFLATAWFCDHVHVHVHTCAYQKCTKKNLAKKDQADRPTPSHGGLVTGIRTIFYCGLMGAANLFLLLTMAVGHDIAFHSCDEPQLGQLILHVVMGLYCGNAHMTYGQYTLKMEWYVNAGVVHFWCLNLGMGWRERDWWLTCTESWRYLMNPSWMQMIQSS